MKPRIQKADWDQVTELACDVVNASAMDDEILKQTKHLPMSNWKLTAAKILSFVAMAIVAGSTVEDLQRPPQSNDQVYLAVATFLSVVLLQWSLWFYVVPLRTPTSVEVRSCFPFFPARTQRGFFGGALSIGYMMVGLYCARLSGYLISGSVGTVYFLIVGLLFIVSGTAARIRDVVTEMDSRA